MDCLGGGRQINCIDVELVLCAAVIVGFPLGTIENQLSLINYSLGFSAESTQVCCRAVIFSHDDDTKANHHFDFLFVLIVRQGKTNWSCAQVLL